jgi:hypothetical protein
MAPSTTTADLVPEPVSKLPERPKEDGSILNEHERSELAFVDKYSAPDVYINEKNDTLWFPWIGPIELKPMRMENRTGTFVVGLRSKVAASLGKHRHRGTVTAITMSGEWGYKEYVTTAKTLYKIGMLIYRDLDMTGLHDLEIGFARTPALSTLCPSRITLISCLPCLAALSFSTMMIA